MLKVESPAFEQGGEIPRKYTCEGEDVSPPLRVLGVPGAAQSLVLIVDDPDAPVGTWTHWTVWDVDVEGVVKEDSVPGTQGHNDFGKVEWGGPCPPGGTHRYFFRVYALDCELGLPEGARRDQLEEAMEGHVLDKGELMGRFSR